MRTLPFSQSQGISYEVTHNHLSWFIWTHDLHDDTIKHLQCHRHPVQPLLGIQVQVTLHQQYIKVYLEGLISGVCLLSHQLCRNPNLTKCGGEAQHLERVGVWSPSGLPNVQSSTARGKTPRIRVLLMSLERSWNVDIENGLALVIWTSAAQVMGKRRTTKSRESTRSRGVLRECDTALESSLQGL
jgi:hypothetical protein